MIRSLFAKLALVAVLGFGSAAVAQAAPAKTAAAKDAQTTPAKSHKKKASKKTKAHHAQTTTDTKK